MDKKKMQNIVLVALPMIAVVLAGMPNAVTVFDLVSHGQSVTCSFFTLVEDVNAAVCFPYAGIFGAVGFGLSVLYLVMKKQSWLKAASVVSFISTTLSVIPVLVGGDVMMIPNMAVPILMGIHCLLASSMSRGPKPAEEDNKGERLENR